MVCMSFNSVSYEINSKSVHKSCVYLCSNAELAFHIVTRNNKYQSLSAYQADKIWATGFVFLAPILRKNLLISCVSLLGTALSLELAYLQLAT